MAAFTSSMPTIWNCAHADDAIPNSRTAALNHRFIARLLEEPSRPSLRRSGAGPVEDKVCSEIDAQDTSRVSERHSWPAAFRPTC